MGGLQGDGNWAPVTGWIARCSPGCIPPAHCPMDPALPPMRSFPADPSTPRACPGGRSGTDVSACHPSWAFHPAWP